jgi:hypothetical protein
VKFHFAGWMPAMASNGIDVQKLGAATSSPATTFSVLPH